MAELIPEYQKELSEMTEKMLGAQSFADIFPAFSDEIISRKLTKEFTGKIAEKYKGFYFGWGINRYFYREKSNITNYKGDFDPQYLWNLYVNSYSIFGEDYTDTGLYEINKKADVFHFDAANTTFYATDDQIMHLLDALAEWYSEAKVENDAFRKEKHRKKLMAELEKLS